MKARSQIHPQASFPPMMETPLPTALLELDLKIPVPPWDVPAWSMFLSQCGDQNWGILFSKYIMTNVEHEEIMTSCSSHEMPFQAARACVGLCNSWLSPLTHRNFWAPPVSRYFSQAPPCSLFRCEVFCIRSSHITLIYLGTGCWHFFELILSCSPFSLPPSCACPQIW